MNNNIVRWAFAAVLLGTLVAGFVWIPQGRAKPPRPAASSQATEPLERQLAELRHEIQMTKALAVATRRERPHEPLSTQDTKAEPSVQSEPPPPELTPERMNDAVEARFHAENYDRSWSIDAQRSISNYLTDTLAPGSRVMQVDCRASLCRAEIRHASHEAYRAFLDNTLRDPTKAWEGPTMHTQQESRDAKEPISIGFFARAGSLLLTEADHAALSLTP